MTVSRKWISVLVAAACLAALLSAPPAFAAKISPPPVVVPASILMTMDGRVLWARNPDTKRKIASTVKMLNALVVMDRAKLTDVVVVSKSAQIWDGGVGLVGGQKLTVKQLLQMMLICSANDAAKALAIHIGGTEKKYVVMMNAKAASLGLKNTLAYDSNGLGKKEHSTARDLSVLARHVMDDPVLHKIVRMHSVSVPHPNGTSTTHSTTDGLLGNYEGMEGVKTGYTDPAGYCFVGACKRDRLELLSVVMGASSNEARFSETRKLLDWGFKHFKVQRLISTEMTVGVVHVTSGVETTLAAVAKRSVTLPIWNGAGPVKFDVILPREMRAPILRRQVLGQVDVTQDGLVLATVPLVASDYVPTRAAAITPVALDRAVLSTPKRGFWQGVASIPGRIIARMFTPAPAPALSRLP